MKTRCFNVLVACEESQAISGEIRRFARDNELSLNAWSCDLLPTSAQSDEVQCTGPEYHLRGDVTKLLAFDDACNYEDVFINSHNTSDKDKKTHKKTLNTVIKLLKGSGWDMIIANPPCTYLAVSGARWYYDNKQENSTYHPRFPTRKIDRAESIRFFMTIAAAPCKYIIIENPVGTLNSNLEGEDYNIGSLPDGYNQPESEEPYKIKFIESVSKEEIESCKSFHELVSILKEKKLPSWPELRSIKIDLNQKKSSLSWISYPDKSYDENQNLHSPSGENIDGNNDFDNNDDDDFKEYLHPIGNEYPVIVQPYMFGDEASKKTCFWVKGIYHKLKETNVVGRGERVVLSSGKSLPKWYSDALSKSKTTEERRTLRSKTFKGISEAIVKQWVLWAAKKEGVIEYETWKDNQQKN